MMIRTAKNAPKREGQVVVISAVSMTALLGFVAVTLDGGLLLNERRKAQRAADAAAAAGAADIYYNYWVESGWDPNGTAEAAAKKLAKQNGFDDDLSHCTVEVYVPPKSGHYLGRPGFCEVIITSYMDRTFSSIFARDPVKVQARSVTIGAPIAEDVGILVLHPSKKSAFTAGGGGNTVVDGTPIIVNSKHAEGSIANGGGYVQALEFALAGGYNTTGGGQFVGPIYTNRQPVEDPLSYLPVPEKSEMTIQSTKKKQYTSGEITLSPGVYEGGISASGTASLNLEPGIYYMDGGGFNFSGQGNLFGEGVLIYSEPGNGNSDGISVTGQGSVQLTPYESGIYEGMTFWQDRTSSVTGKISGTGDRTSITGTFYFAGALLEISGNGGVSNLGSQYISNELTLGGNGDIHITWGPDRVARRRTITLVE